MASNLCQKTRLKIPLRNPLSLKVTITTPESLKIPMGSDWQYLIKKTSGWELPFKFEITDQYGETLIVVDLGSQVVEAGVSFQPSVPPVRAASIDYMPFFTSVFHHYYFFENAVNYTDGVAWK